MWMLLYSVFLQVGLTGEMAALDLQAKCACENDRSEKVFSEDADSEQGRTEQLPAK